MTAEGFTIKTGSVELEALGNGVYGASVDLGAKPKFAFVQEPNGRSGPVWMSVGQTIGNSSVSGVLTNTGISLGTLSSVSGTAYYFAVM